MSKRQRQGKQAVGAQPAEPPVSAEVLRGQVDAANGRLAVLYQDAARAYASASFPSGRDAYKVAEALSKEFEHTVRVAVVFERGEPGLRVEPVPVTYAGEYPDREITRGELERSADAAGKAAAKSVWELWPTPAELSRFARGYRAALGDGARELEDLRRKLRDATEGPTPFGGLRVMGRHLWPMMMG